MRFCSSLVGCENVSASRPKRPSKSSGEVPWSAWEGEESLEAIWKATEKKGATDGSW